MANGINSKERVKQHGEVFTPDSIVNDMLDLIDEKYSGLSSITENNEDIRGYIDKTYLEPSCGDGQFLIRILYRKLIKVKELPLEQRANALIRALASIYGVDIQNDNVLIARKRITSVALGDTVQSFDLNDKMNEIQVNLDVEYTDELKKAINFVIENNIVCGDTLIEKGNTCEVKLTCYHFNNDKVSLALANLNSLDNEMDKTEEVDIIDIYKLKINKSDVIDSFDF